MTDVRDSVRDENPDLADQAEANSRDDFVRERDNLLIGAALAVGGDRERQATLLKALLDEEDFRVRAGELIFGAIYDGYRSPPEASGLAEARPVAALDSGLAVTRSPRRAHVR